MAKYEFEKHGHLFCDALHNQAVEACNSRDIHLVAKLVEEVRRTERLIRNLRVRIGGSDND